MSSTNTPVASKPFATSLTIQGIIVSLVGAFAPNIAAMLHIDAGDVTNIVSMAVALIGAIMAVIGRMRASTALH